MREYVAADFKHTGKKLHKKKAHKKAIYDANNARNRDSFAVTKSNGMLKGMDSLKDDMHRSTNLSETEDTLIDVLDDFHNGKDDLSKK